MTRPEPGIVHLGIGAFFRAFGVPWLEDVMAAAGGDWGVIGVSLRSGGVRNALVARDFAYHALEQSPETPAPRDIRALRDVLVAPEDPQAVVDAMADPAIRIVSLSVTEKGYCYAPATGGLDLAHPGIIHELANPEAPDTAPGFIVAALAKRRREGHAPFTCLSCDNLPGNGAILRQVVLDLARRIDPNLADWIAAKDRFPQTMIDRIVPATTRADIAHVQVLTGIADTGVVVHEPFRQWVIEDDFVDGIRPAFEAAGVQMVTDVAPYEHMKLRCLNGAHSALAYLGVLGGKATISDAVSDPDYRRLINGLWREEIVPSFAPPPGEDPLEYTRRLMQRFANPAIQHRTIQIAMDGSQKLPQRILATIGDNLAAGRSIARLALVVAAWVMFLRGEDQAGQAFEVNDPMAARLQAIATGAEPLAGILQVSEVFAPELAADRRFQVALAAGYSRLRDAKVNDVLQELSA